MSVPIPKPESTNILPMQKQFIQVSSVAVQATALSSHGGSEVSEKNNETIPLENGELAKPPSCISPLGRTNFYLRNKDAILESKDLFRKLAAG